MSILGDYPAGNMDLLIGDDELIRPVDKKAVYEPRKQSTTCKEGKKSWPKEKTSNVFLPA